MIWSLFLILCLLVNSSVSVSLRSVLMLRGGGKKSATKKSSSKGKATHVAKAAIKPTKLKKKVVQYDDQDDKEDDYDDEDESEDEEDDYSESSDAEDEDFSPRKRKVKQKSLFDLGIETASDAMNVALKLGKGTVKSAVDLAANKHVAEYQIYGKWRFMQEIEVKKGVFISSPATIEFMEDGTVVTVCDGQKYESEYVFKEKPWPRKCKIYFQARAFQGPKDQEPVNMFYKGYFKRSLLNPNVVLIRGNVYKLAGKMFWKQQQKAGTFKATKRKYG